MCVANGKILHPKLLPSYRGGVTFIQGSAAIAQVVEGGGLVYRNTWYITLGLHRVPRSIHILREIWRSWRLGEKPVTPWQIEGCWGAVWLTPLAAPCNFGRRGRHAIVKTQGWALDSLTQHAGGFESIGTKKEKCFSLLKSPLILGPHQPQLYSSSSSLFCLLSLAIKLALRSS